MSYDAKHQSWLEDLERKTRALEFWSKLGLKRSYANALIDGGYFGLKDLRRVTDREFAVMHGVGEKGRREIYRLMGKKPPGNAKSPEEIQAQFERLWRERLGAERLQKVIADIVEMAGDDIEQRSVSASRALWGMARRRFSTGTAN